VQPVIYLLEKKLFGKKKSLRNNYTFIHVYTYTFYTCLTVSDTMKSLSNFLFW